VAEGQILDNPVNVGWAEQGSLSQRPSPSGAFALHQMPPAGSAEQHFPSGGYFETFGYGFSGSRSLGASHIVSF